MKKLMNHSQLKEQENSHEAANNEINLFSLIGAEWKKKKKGDRVYTEGIKAIYEVIKSRYKQ